MNLSDETAADFYSRILSELSLKARSGKAITSMTNIKITCDDIEAAKGIMNYSKVAEFAIKHYNGPHHSTIQNNSILKNYIYKRMCEYKGHTNKKQSSQQATNHYKYPTAELDIKTWSHFDLLYDTIKNLENKVANLNAIIEEKTSKNPIKFSDIINIGPQKNNSLLIPPLKNNLIPQCVAIFLKKILGMDSALGNLKSFEMLQRENRHMVFSNDSKMALLTPAECEEIKYWINELKI